MPGARSATVGFWVAVGSRDEQPGERGSTHFLEHLLFKGTRDALRARHRGRLRVGRRRAQRRHREGVHLLLRPGARRRPRRRRSTSSPTCSPRRRSTPDEFETERGVILEELAMADDDPADVAGERLFEAVFGEHPLGRPIGGIPESIQRGAPRRRARPLPGELPPPRPRRHGRRRRRPRPPRRAARGGARAGRLARPTPPPPVPRRVDRGRRAGARASRSSSSAAPSSRPPSCWACPASPRPTTAGPPSRVLNSVLGGGMSSRLFQEIRERRGLAYSVYSFAPSYSDAGPLRPLRRLHARQRRRRRGTPHARRARPRSPTTASPTDERQPRARPARRRGRPRARGQRHAHEPPRPRRARRPASSSTSTPPSPGSTASTTDDVRDLAADLRSGPLSTVVVGDVDDTPSTPRRRRRSPATP